MKLGSPSPQIGDVIREATLVGSPHSRLPVIRPALNNYP
jgi:hypothetical protein